MATELRSRGADAIYVDMGRGRFFTILVGYYSPEQLHELAKIVAETAKGI